tara:strand:+ start:367 stop:1263 length:897 start_codon:yes stop_codon:yes gene_type:complete
MKKIFITYTLLISFAFSQYLQEGLYPDCSYVIVTEDGWKIHKNQDGRIVSMMPKEKHNYEVGKYSFDKYGNLIPFIECNSMQKLIDNTTKKIEEKEVSDSTTEIDIEVKIDLMKNLSFSIHGGGLIPYGENISEFDIGAQGGVDIKLKNYTLSIMGGTLSGDFTTTEVWGGNTIIDGEDEVEIPEYNVNLTSNLDLTQTGIFAGYTFNFGKFYMTPAVGMINTTGTGTLKTLEALGELFVCEDDCEIEEESFSDTGIKAEVGMSFGKFSVYGGGIYTTTFLEREQTASFFTAGLKYNF